MKENQLPRTLAASVLFTGFAIASPPRTMLLSDGRVARPPRCGRPSPRPDHRRGPRGKRAPLPAGEGRRIDPPGGDGRRGHRDARPDPRAPAVVAAPSPRATSRCPAHPRPGARRRRGHDGARAAIRYAFDPTRRAARDDRDRRSRGARGRPRLPALPDRRPRHGRPDRVGSAPCPTRPPPVCAARARPAGRRQRGHPAALRDEGPAAAAPRSPNGYREYPAEAARGCGSCAARWRSVSRWTSWPHPGGARSRRRALPAVRALAEAKLALIEDRLGRCRRRSACAGCFCVGTASSRRRPRAGGRGCSTRSRAWWNDPAWPRRSSRPRSRGKGKR